MNPNRFTVKVRRKREGKTDFKSRRNLLLAEKPRLVVRKSLKNVWLQLVLYQAKGDKVITTAHSRELIKHGWKYCRKNIPAAYLTGLLFAQKAKKAGITHAVPDMGMLSSVKGSKLYAALWGVKEGGIEVPLDESMRPSNDRLHGKHAQPNMEKSILELKKKVIV